MGVIVRIALERAQDQDLHQLSELEVLSRNLTGWSRFDGLSKQEYMRFNDLPAFDRGEIVRKFIEFRRTHPKKEVAI